MSFKNTIFDLIDESRKNKNRWNRTVDIAIITLILLSIISIILESYQEIRLTYDETLKGFEFFSIIIFSMEYILRIWTADLKYPKMSKWKARLKFMTSAIGIIDLVAILPFYLPFILKFDLRFIRILRVFRLLRIFKLSRYTKSLKLLGSIFYEKKTELGITVLATFILMLISSTIMYNLEHEAQPKDFPNIIETFWWAVATLTTVGYGDVYPITGMGKFFGGIIALLGIGLVALPTGILSAGFIEKIENKNKKKSGFNYCPHCGEQLKG